MTSAQLINATSEVWKTIYGFPKYEVSNLGRVRSFWGHSRPLAHICCGNFDHDGYRKIVLTGDNKSKRTFKFAKLVAEAFLGTAPDGMEIAHKNGVEHDDRADNLEYKTHKNNIADKIRHGTTARGEHHGQSKLNRRIVLHIRSSTESCASLANRFGIALCTVSAIRTRRTWAWLEALP